MERYVNLKDIRQLTENDIQQIVDNFNKCNWGKSVSTFESYLNEQKIGERVVWVAFYKNQFAGYATLKWRSGYKFFKDKNIPEINDLNVLPNMRFNGVGSALLDIAENVAVERSNIIGLGVGLYKDYGDAQKLYIKRGYVPDGRGITYKYQYIKAGTRVVVDDDLILWFIKELNFVCR
ncbi:MAG: GNAT family N-acetyltransferase [Alphaproteobacteria bacterium]